MTPKESALLVMAKMALADDHLAAEEIAWLQPLIDEGQSLESILQKARDSTLEELLAGVDRYADRFFIALQAATMAQVDRRLEEAETAFYESLLARLKLRPEDVQLIRISIEQLDETEPMEPDPRIGELFELSSFV